MGLREEVSRSGCGPGPSPGPRKEAVRESAEVEADGSRPEAQVGAPRDIIGRGKEVGSPGESAQIQNGETRRLEPPLRGEETRMLSDRTKAALDAYKARAG